MKLSAIIPNYNGATTIVNTLASLTQQLPENAELLVIDDCSTDDSIELIHAEFPSVQVHSNSRNLGAAASRNTGIKLTRGDLLLFVDADVSPQARCIELMLQLEDDADIVFPKIVYPNGMVMYPITEQQESYLLISPIFLLKRKSLNKLDNQPFDEVYETYCEDTDFFLRSYLAGLTCSYRRDAVAVHNVSALPSNRETRYGLEARNSIYGGLKFFGIKPVSQFDHAFKISSIAKVIISGIFNFNLFDIQARGLEKTGSGLQKIKLLLGNHGKLSPLGSPILVGFILRAILWNARHLPQTLRTRKETISHLARSSL